MQFSWQRAQSSQSQEHQERQSRRSGATSTDSFCPVKSLMNAGRASNFPMKCSLDFPCAMHLPFDAADTKLRRHRWWRRWRRGAPASAPSLLGDGTGCSSCCRCTCHWPGAQWIRPNGAAAASLLGGLVKMGATCLVSPGGIRGPRFGNTRGEVVGGVVRSN